MRLHPRPALLSPPQLGRRSHPRLPSSAGAKGFPAWAIPPGATLEFTLECLQIK